MILLFKPAVPIRWIDHRSYGAIMTPLRLFLLPGDLVSDALHVADPDSRSMLRTLVNMLVWNFVGVMAVLPFI